jgi:restriction system protein
VQTLCKDFGPPWRVASPWRGPAIAGRATRSQRLSAKVIEFPDSDLFVSPPRARAAMPLANLARIDAQPPTRGTAPQTTVELLEQLRSIDWFQFEKLVALAYRKLGYTVTRRGGANPDGGIDLVIEKDGQRSAVQCKQWKTWNVGVKAVREFLGALTHAEIQKGIFITLRGYTGEAKQLAEEHGIEIVNEAGLAQMLEETDAIFDPETLDILTDTRKFCPKCGSEMVLRTATKGLGAGGQFWGCSTYPRCRFILH